MNKLILDYSKWRCGGDSAINKLGEGSTKMENAEGFCCCLGLFSPQLNTDVSTADMLGRGEPEDIRKIIPLLTGSAQENDDRGVWYRNKGISTSAIDINDEDSTTPQEKIVLLKELFLKEGYEIEVINQPLNLN